MKNTCSHHEKCGFFRLSGHHVSWICFHSSRLRKVKINCKPTPQRCRKKVMTMKKFIVKNSASGKNTIEKFPESSLSFCGSESNSSRCLFALKISRITSCNYFDNDNKAIKRSQWCADKPRTWFANGVGQLWRLHRHFVVHSSTILKFIPSFVRCWQQMHKRGNRIVSFCPASFAQRHKFTFSTRQQCFRLDELSQNSGTLGRSQKKNINTLQQPIAFRIEGSCNSPETTKLSTWLWRCICIAEGCNIRTSAQDRSQVLGFGGQMHLFGAKVFVFIICLKQIFLGTTKFGG